MKTFIRILPWIACIILAILLIRGCHKYQWQKQPKVEPVKEQQAKVQVIVKEDTRARDSILKLLDQEKENTETLTVINSEIQKDYNTLQQMVAGHVEKDCPQITPELERLAKKREDELKSHGQIVKSLNKRISLKDADIKQCDLTKGRLLSRLDSSFQNQTALQKSNDKLRPRTQFVLSAEAFGTSGKILNGYGVGAGLRFKNGTMMLIKGYVINGQQNYGAQVVFPISFRK